MFAFAAVAASVTGNVPGLAGWRAKVLEGPRGGRSRSRIGRCRRGCGRARGRAEDDTEAGDPDDPHDPARAGRCST
ncbi:hypothetical protein Sme01_16850 [Sphaerisporangium melleum]|uniref:Uncharacterized protein n=1 Tax=Sphaerisporangium melleum TaxID=321316 RepID=A0A917R208_9ACTN|nr:hypothetical protein GCM10007964_26790 [Sphaerisporangium melleum]GII69209.1 hypothetical protein Sme01_16850 [Sphaerisporangium melleum]